MAKEILYWNLISTSMLNLISNLTVLKIVMMTQQQAYFATPDLFNEWQERLSMWMCLYSYSWVLLYPSYSNHLFYNYIYEDCKIIIWTQTKLLLSCSLYYLLSHIFPSVSHVLYIYKQKQWQLFVVDYDQWYLYKVYNWNIKTVSLSIV